MTPIRIRRPYTVPRVSLPAWLEPLPVAEEMRATDRWAIEERGVPSLDLMERAGAGLADLATEVAPSGPVVVVCGGGNNGGDGYVAARLLADAGREVRVATVTDPAKLEGDARAVFEQWDGEVVPFEPAVLADAVVAVDAMLGTGFSGRVRAPARDAILSLNESKASIVAADVPSGVDASTGAVEDVAVRAQATATFHQAKPGLWIHPGKEHAGVVRRIEIGIPDGVPVEPSIGLLTPRVADAIPGRGAASTKFSSGHVLVAGGSTGLTGAPCLAAEGAMRAGAGYVTCCVPGSLNAIFEVRLLEVMTIALPDEDGHHVTEGVDRVVDEAEKRGGALVVGPGASRADGAVAFVRELAARAEVALVLDADGLNAHAERLDDLGRRRAPTILTPHAGELGRLLGRESAAVGAQRLASAREAAEAAGAVVVLKGDDTIVAEPAGRVAVSPGGAPALATAGTGDVLSGVIGAMLAKGLDPFTAACAGVRLHLDAGRSAAAGRHADSVIASDVVDALGR
jgi:ADP-dependent NAD(P)H-hydrate dehydratase / NAD(P)H-hydrate epimerase